MVIKKNNFIKIDNKKITVVDYGINNLKSIERAINSIGYEVLISSNVSDYINSDKIILPGVGSFESGMNELKKLKAIPSLEKAFSKKKDILGICLGMQMLMEESEEFGIHKGLGFIKGSVKKIPSMDTNKRKIPHIGWNTLLYNSASDNDGIDFIKNATVQDSYFYFVHSYYAEPESSNNIGCYTYYENFKFASVICLDNLIGFQFHPEKSASNGLNLLNSFLSK